MSASNAAAQLLLTTVTKEAPQGVLQQRDALLNQQPRLKGLP
jgi:hypothetical protein